MPRARVKVLRSGVRQPDGCVGIRQQMVRRISSCLAALGHARACLNFRRRLAVSGCARLQIADRVRLRLDIPGCGIAAATAGGHS